MSTTRSKIFQYAVIWHPTEAESKEGLVSKLILDVQNVLGVDKDSILMGAAMEIPSEYKNKLDQIEVVIRPF